MSFPRCILTEYFFLYSLYFIVDTGAILLVDGLKINKLQDALILRRFTTQASSAVYPEGMYHEKFSYGHHGIHHFLNCSDDFRSD